MGCHATHHVSDDEHEREGEADDEGDDADDEQRVAGAHLGAGPEQARVQHQGAVEDLDGISSER